MRPNNYYCVAACVRRWVVVEWSRRLGATPAGGRWRYAGDGEQYGDHRQDGKSDPLVRPASRRQPRRLLPLHHRPSHLCGRSRLPYRPARVLGPRTYAIDTACLKPSRRPQPRGDFLTENFRVSGGVVTIVWRI